MSIEEYFLKEDKGVLHNLAEAGGGDIALADDTGTLEIVVSSYTANENADYLKIEGLVKGDPDEILRMVSKFTIVAYNSGPPKISITRTPTPEQIQSFAASQ